MTTTRLVALLTGLAGLLTLAITVAFTLLPAVAAAGACVASGDVIAFELATTLAELTRIFHPLGDPCRPPALAAMDQVNTLDVFAYIPAYTAFAILAVQFVAGDLRRPLPLAAVAAAVLALVADYVETTALLTITKDVEAGLALTGRASMAAWIKFGALAGHAALLAAVCFTGQPRRRVLGGLLLLPLPAFLVMVADPTRHGLLSLAFFASWTPLMLMALWEALRPRPAVALPVSGE
jgi:hypothetical protein